MVPGRNREWWCPHEVWTLANLHVGDMTGPSSPACVFKPFRQILSEIQTIFKVEVTWNLALGQRN